MNTNSPILAHQIHADEYVKIIQDTVGLPLSAMEGRPTLFCFEIVNKGAPTEGKEISMMWGETVNDAHRRLCFLTKNPPNAVNPLSIGILPPEIQSGFQIEQSFFMTDPQFRTILKKWADNAVKNIGEKVS